MGFNEFIDAFISIGVFAKELPKLLLAIGKALPKLLSLFTIFTDPIKVIKDIVFGISTGIYMILDAVIDMLFGDIRSAMGLSSAQGSNDGDQESENKKCMSPSLVKILLLVLCPPLALLLERGIHAILYVIICCILTYFYYFPGLIYACLYLF